MKKNNKGFMLAEIIIVTVVVVSVMTSLFIVFNRVYTAYDKKSSYSDIDAIYALKMIEDYMIETETSDTFWFNEFIENNNTFTKITCNTSNSEFNTFCNKIFSEYNVNEMYIVKNNENSLKSLKNTVSNLTFTDYIDYLMNIGIHTINFLGNNDIYAELLVVETYSIDSSNASDKKILNKYAYLPTRKIEG